MSTAAEQLSRWIEKTHPDLFDTLYSHVQRRRTSAAIARARLRGFGQDDGADMASFDPAIPDSSVDLAPVTVDIPTLTSSDLQTPGVNVAIDPGPDVTSALDVSTDNSGTGFLQSIGSGITTAASNVANFLTSNQGLSDLTKLGTAFFQYQNNQVNAQLQTQVLQAQVARAQAGQSPAPVTYAMVGGKLVPVYTSNPLATVNGALISPGSMPSGLVAAISAGQSQLVTLPDGTTGYTVPPSVVGSLSLQGVSLQQMLPWILLIGGGLLVLKALR